MNKEHFKTTSISSVANSTSFQHKSGRVATMSTYYLEKETYYWWKVVLEGCLLWGLFLTLHYLVLGQMKLEYQSIHSLSLLFGSWFLATILSKKFKRLPNRNFFYELKVFVISSLVLTLALTIGFYFRLLYPPSRLVIYWTVLGLSLCEIVYLLLIHFNHFILSRHESSNHHRLNVQTLILFFCETVAIICVILAFYSAQRGSVTPNHDYFIVVMFFSWIIISLFTHRFAIRRNGTYIKTLLPFFQAQIFLVIIVTTVVYWLMLPVKFTLGALAWFSLLEILLVTGFYIYQKPVMDDENFSRLLPLRIEEDENLADFFVTPEQNKAPYQPAQSRVTAVSLTEKLEKVFLANFNSVFLFVNDIIDTQAIDLLKAVSFYTSNPYNIESLENSSMSFIMNLQVVNNIRKINQYFIEVNQKLTQGGIFIGKFESIEQREKRLCRDYPAIFTNIFYFFDFCYRRVCPKLPYLKKVYFALSKGRNRVISKAECLGRLYFCGFELLALKEIDNHFYFIAKKVNEPLTGQNPSYGPIFKQRRVGQERKIIYIYKMRTMFPFSEYLHRYMVETDNLKENGKIHNDFRITGWGRVFRKFWIDEIVMIFNLIKGDVKLVGVRPLSETFFNIYPGELQKLRTRFKPGLIPPFYYDLPNCIEEVWESEYNYLKRYTENPIRTDMIYFLKAAYNIIFRHAKSG